VNRPIHPDDEQPLAEEEERPDRFSPDSRSGEGAETALHRLKELERRHSERPQGTPA
jgi:hypothetical protein